MNTEDLDNLTKRFASEVAEFEREKDYINGGFVVGLFRKYLIEAEKEAWNAAIDAASDLSGTAFIEEGYYSVARQDSILELKIKA